MATKSKAGGGSAKERVAAMRAAEKRKERLRWLLTFSVVLVIVAALVGGAFWAIQKSDEDKKKKAEKANAARLAEGPPKGGSWALPADPVAAAEKLGLEVKGGMEEGSAKHEHSHLSIFINGQPVAVPANLGIDTLSGHIAELHTHDARGVIHVEAFQSKPFYLDQVFKIWEVPLSASEIGLLKTDATHTLKFYVDGKEVTEDPSKIELTAHREIGVVYGTAADNAKVKVPASFQFDNGE
ncbi:hypothetical protein [Actinocorallia longicatena]|uniref:Uncharacterized protein n=1 Tax=Actinocorallia longicatena TaxID=111803 RepID=A0ABP6QAY8_9ACTN